MKTLYKESEKKEDNEAFLGRWVLLLKMELSNSLKEKREYMETMWCSTFETFRLQTYGLVLAFSKK